MLYRRSKTRRVSKVYVGKASDIVNPKIEIEVVKKPKEEITHEMLEPGDVYEYENGAIGLCCNDSEGETYWLLTHTAGTFWGAEVECYLYIPIRRVLGNITKITIEPKETAAARKLTDEEIADDWHEKAE